MIYKGVRKVQLLKEFEGGTCYWCEACRDQDHEMIRKTFGPSKHDCENTDHIRNSSIFKKYMEDK
jgi:hypothetical protein